MSSKQNNCNDHSLVSKEFCCPICYECFTTTNGNDNQSFLYQSFTHCKHAICWTCLYSHCEHAISTKQIPIPCPSHAGGDEELGCSHILSDAEVHQILLAAPPKFRRDNNATLWKRYLRFSRLAQDPTLIACPRCDELCPSPSTAKKDESSYTTQDEEFPSAVMTCQACQHIFCRYHGDTHDITRQSCREYMKNSTQIQESVSVLERCTKPCSTCGCRLVKHAGCDHVVCPLCANDMCWKCGSHRYLTGKVIRTCQKCQQGYLDHRYDRQHRIRMVLMLPFIVPFVVLYVVLVSAVAVGSGLFLACCCCTMGTSFLEDHQRHWNPRKAIHTGVAIVILPILLIMTDFGWHFDVVDEITESNQANVERNRNERGVAFPHHLPKSSLPEIPIAKTMDEDDEDFYETYEEQQIQYMHTGENTTRHDQNV